MKKKIFLLVLALVCLMAVPALAVVPSLQLFGIDVMLSPSGEIGGGSYEYDSATKTLTLNGVTIPGGENWLLREMKDSLDTIVLEGKNVFGTDEHPLNTYDVRLDGDTVFTGSGSLSVISDVAYPLSVLDGTLKIDGVEIQVYASASGLYLNDGDLVLCNGASLMVKDTDQYTYGTIYNSTGDIHVTGGSRLIIDSQCFGYSNWNAYENNLFVEDTSSVEIMSLNKGLPKQTKAAADSVKLEMQGKEGQYILSFDEGSGKYLYTVTQTALNDERGRNKVTITGSVNPEGGASMPETGDEAMPVLWSLMFLTAAAYFIFRKRAEA